MRPMRSIAVLMAVGLVAACHRGGPAPTGQVVATVDGDEITSNELRMELGNAKGRNPQEQKALERAALQSIVNRHILAKAARDQKVDKTPLFAMQQKKAEDILVISSLEQKIAASVPAPSAEEAGRFVAEHPDSFGQRKLFVVDQIIAPRLTMELVKGMEPLKTLAQVDDYLTQKGAPHQKAVSAIDGGTTDPEMVKKIAALPAGEVFIIPNGGGAVMNTVRDTKIDPIGGAAASNAAMAMLRQRRTQEIVRKQMEQMVIAGRGKVKYNADYAPTPAPAKPAG